MKHIRLENTDSDLAILEDVTSSKASKLYKKTLADALFFLFFLAVNHNKVVFYSLST